MAIAGLGFAAGMILVTAMLGLTSHSTNPTAFAERWPEWYIAALTVLGAPLTGCTALFVRGRALQDRCHTIRAWTDALLNAERHIALGQDGLALRLAVVLKRYAAQFTGTRAHLRQLWQQCEVLLWSMAVFLGSQLGPALFDLWTFGPEHEARIAAEALVLNPAVVAWQITAGAVSTMIGCLLAEALWLATPPLVRTRAVTSRFADLD